MSDAPHTVTVEIEGEKTRRAKMFRTVILVIAGGVPTALLFLAALGTLNPQFPSLHIISLIIFVGPTALLSFWLNRQGHLFLAIGVYLVSMTVTLLVAIFLTNGVTGPLAVMLVTIPVEAGLLAGRKAARWMAVTVAILYTVMTILEASNVLQPWEITGTSLPVLFVASLVCTVAVTTMIVIAFVRQSEQALSTAQQRQRELITATRQAEQAAQAEQEARGREEKAARRLRQAVQQFGAFLERVESGDYSARLDLDEVDQAGEEGRELLALGQRLNSTVESLVKALSELQTVQRRYESEAWHGFAQTGAVHRGFRYKDTEVAPDDEAWLAPMDKAVQEKRAAVDGCELGLPITLRGEVVGAIGARREESTGWSDDDVALVAAITEQLAQTIDSLRLLDETQRRAAHEQLVGQVTARMRETLDLETVLQTAADEMHQTLGLERIVIRLAETDGDSAQERER